MLFVFFVVRWPYIVSRLQGGPDGKHPLTYAGLPISAFHWKTRGAPAWLSEPPEVVEPLKLRVAILSHPKEYERRQAIRDYILAGVPESEVQLEYYFFLGGAVRDRWYRWRGTSGYNIEDALHDEILVHDDIYLFDMPEHRANLGAKRWRALQWAAEANVSTYDWFFTVETDCFVRFAALARRLSALHPRLRRPREQSIIWGQMRSANRHWRSWNNDIPVRGNLYSYPVGFGYLLSSYLVDRLTAPEIDLPYNVTSYAYDDMLVGSWISDVAPDTIVVDDWDGFHAPPRLGWETVVTHRLDVTEMRAFREMEQWKGEWEE